ncbi:MULTISPECIES: hypothetical protein [Methylomonas]|uniref:Uncharacterized protein n=2 Tax=Methylomonas TaxID=416 RepID=A0A140E752_9GAMM|nr:MULTISPECIES: hypothetical protein [Methylomonas]AMK79226.1 hypothetical protein JT25_022530 [Methylomonas denitrificans]OAH98146.1 hypothetical protein A1342_00290 [Methylomonas methanica]TCV86255.1 hypothetical protein EDE11_104199 [Methylomonas methanica]
MTQIRPSATAHGRKQSRASRKSQTWQQVTLIVLGTALSVSALSGPSAFPTGTARYDPGKAYNSFVLFSGGNNIAYLIDLNSNSIHEWKDAASHGTLLNPAVNGGKLGHVFVTQETAEGRANANNSLYRGQPVPYDWVPAGTPHSENPVNTADLSKFRLPVASNNP